MCLFLFFISLSVLCVRMIYGSQGNTKNFSYSSGKISKLQADISSQRLRICTAQTALEIAANAYSKSDSHCDNKVIVLQRSLDAELRKMRDLENQLAECRQNIN